MSRYIHTDIDPDVTNGDQLANDILDPFIAAVMSGNLGSGPADFDPVYAASGYMYLEQSGTEWIFRLRDASGSPMVDVEIWRYDLLTGEVTQAGTGGGSVSDLLQAISDAGSGANKFAYYTGVDTVALGDITSFGRSLIDDAAASNARTTLGLVIGTDVQAYDAELAALAGLTSAADSLPYFSGSGAASLTTLTSFARTLLDDTDASTARTTLGLAIGTNVQAYDAELAAIAGLTSAADRLPYFTGSGAAALATFTSYGRSIVAVADEAALKTLINAEAGVDFQAYDADLAAIAGLTSAADKGIHFTGAGAAATHDLTAFARTLLDDADASTARSTLGVAIGSAVQAWDADLDAIAALAPSQGSFLVRGASAWEAMAGITAVQWLPAFTGSNGGSPDLGSKGLVPAPTAADNGRFLKGDGTWADVSVTDAELLAIAGLVSAADRLPYFTGSGTADLAVFTSFARTLLDDADATAARTTLGLTIGTNVQAYDAELAALAGLTSAADSLPYFTGAGAAALTTLTSFARTLLDDTDASTMRTTLGLVIGTNVQAYDPELAALAGLTSAADSLPYFTGSGTAALATLTTYGRSLIDDADAAAARTTLGLVIGTNVQAYDPELAALAGLTSAADALPYFTGSGAAAVTTLSSFMRTVLDDTSSSAARTTLGLAIGSDVQAYDSDLAAIAALAPAYGTFMVRGASAWEAFTGGQATALLSNFVGTDGGSPDLGAKGLVPAPALADLNSFLKATGAWSRIRPTVQIFTGDGTWNRPPGCTRIHVAVQAPGGGGGGAGATGQGCGAGGGGGEYAEKWIDNPASSETVTAPAGGAGGAAGNNNGSDGAGAASFGSHVSANPGKGGAGVTGTTTAAVSFATDGGTGGTGGDIHVPGQQGGAGVTIGGIRVPINTGGASRWGPGGGVLTTGAGNAPVKGAAN